MNGHRRMAVLLLYAMQFEGIDRPSIDFELGAPELFADTVALTSEYAASGVVFAGPAPLDGGGVLNQGGNFGIDARSGTDFLAFNRNSTFSDGGTPLDPQDLFFALNVRDVSMYVGSGDDTVFLMEGFRNGQLVASQSVTTSGGQWSELSVANAGGFDQITISEIGNLNFFVMDDLSFTAVPEPGAIGILFVAALGFCRRARK